MGSKRKKKKEKKTEYEGFNYGPIKVERIGRTIQMSSDWDPEEFKKHKTRIKNRRPHLKNEINHKIRRLILLIKQFEPFDLLTSVSLRNIYSNPETYREITHEGKESFVEYAQSLIIGIKRNSKVKEPSKDEIEEFNNLISEIFHDVLWYFGTEVVEEKRSAVEEEMRFISMSTYLLLRGDSYSEHHMDLVREIFQEHDNFLKKHIGFDTSYVINAVENIEQQLTENLLNEIKISKYMNVLHKLYQEFIEKEGRDSFKSLEDCKNKFYSEPNVMEKKKELDVIFGKLKKNICEITPTDVTSSKLLKLLSSQLGDNSTFIEFNKSPAWPTNDSNIYEAPLIEDNGKFYCFAPQVLNRNIGNIIEGWIRQADKQYFITDYQEKRARLLEKKGIEYLSKILPGAEVYENLYYTINENGKSKRVETDGLIIYDENLLIIEAKSGSLSTSAKRGGLERMKNDLSELLGSAYEQALRTKKYIVTEAVPTFEYKDKSIAKVIKNKNKYRNIFLVNITMQNLGHFATHLNSLKSIKLIQGKEWPWSVFINDLRVISEIMESPTEFLHYLQRRIKVNDYPQFRAIDELDFLMFYLNDGLFVEDINLKDVSMFTLGGYTEKLDRYYDFKAGYVSSGEKPKLNISAEFKNFISLIESTGKFGFTRVTTTLLSFDSENQKNILVNLRKTKIKSQKDGRDHDLSIIVFIAKIGMTFYVTQNRDLEHWRSVEIYCRLKMYQMQWDEWIAVSVDLNKDVTNELDFRIFKKKWQYNKEMEKALKKFKEDKLEKFINSGQKIGRNDLCPCGGGKKYKKCCGK